MAARQKDHKEKIPEYATALNQLNIHGTEVNSSWPYCLFQTKSTSSALNAIAEDGPAEAQSYEN